jgi:predicted TIM-barrel fold metal-dependent hydrolase
MTVTANERDFLYIDSDGHILEPPTGMLEFAPAAYRDRIWHVESGPIIWASDYPHPDAKFPGITEELTEALEGLSYEQQRAITSESALALYGIG